MLSKIKDIFKVKKVYQSLFITLKKKIVYFNIFINTIICLWQDRNEVMTKH